MSLDPFIFKPLRELLIEHEGVEFTPYRCTSGKLSIGVGRNLEDVGISESEAMMLLENDIKRVSLETERAFPKMNHLSPVRQIVILSMAFNIGITKLLEFKKMINALEKEDYSQASHEMMNSLWAAQVKGRAVELAVMMESGKTKQRGNV